MQAAGTSDATLARPVISLHNVMRPYSSAQVDTLYHPAPRQHMQTSPARLPGKMNIYKLVETTMNTNPPDPLAHVIDTRVLSVGE